MKRLFFIGTIAFAAMFIGCTKEQIIANHLDGKKWKIVSIGGSTVVTENGVQKSSTTPDQDGLNTILAFEDDHTGIMTEPDLEEESFTWTNNADLLTISGFATFQVTEDGSKKQTWKYAYSNTDIQTSGGTTTTTKTVSEVIYTLEVVE